MLVVVQKTRKDNGDLKYICLLMLNLMSALGKDLLPRMVGNIDHQFSIIYLILI